MAATTSDVGQPLLAAQTVPRVMKRHIFCVRSMVRSAHKTLRIVSARGAREREREKRRERGGESSAYREGRDGKKHRDVLALMVYTWKIVLGSEGHEDSCQKIPRFMALAGNLQWN